eukprot:scaffold15309_cov198-Amphora_coffeaeformis.AAC.3
MDQRFGRGQPEKSISFLPPVLRSFKSSPFVPSHRTIKKVSTEEGRRREKPKKLHRTRLGFRLGQPRTLFNGCDVNISSTCTCDSSRLVSMTRPSVAVSLRVGSLLSSFVSALSLWPGLAKCVASSCIAR